LSFERVNFKDGNVYHDYHYNGMQENIDKEIDQRNVVNFYKTKLMFYNLDYIFIDPLIDVTNTSVSNVDNMSYDRDNLLYLAENDVDNCKYSSRTINLPNSARHIVVSSQYDISEETNVTHRIYYNDKHITINEGEEYRLDENANNLRLTINFYNLDKSNKPPALHNYCIMWS